MEKPFLAALTILPNTSARHALLVDNLRLLFTIGVLTIQNKQTLDMLETSALIRVALHVAESFVI